MEPIFEQNLFSNYDGNHFSEEIFLDTNFFTQGKSPSLFNHNFPFSNPYDSEQEEEDQVSREKEDFFQNKRNERDYPEEHESESEEKTGKNQPGLIDFGLNKSFSSINSNESLNLINSYILPDNPENNKKIDFPNEKMKKTTCTSKVSQPLNLELIKASQDSGVPLSDNSTNPINISKRIDYHVKYFKTNFSSFLTKSCNEKISCLPKNIKKKISLPNHESFTGNPKESDNYAFLSFSVREILCYSKKGKDGNSKNSRQEKNKVKIQKILDYIEGENDEKYEEIESFFNMKLEDAYSLFYQSPEFEEYSKDNKTIFLDGEFKAQKGFSLLEPNGFIKMLKMYKNN